MSIGIAGINNWRKKVKKDYNFITSKKNFKNLVIFADADCCYNPSIFIQFKEMLAQELQGIKQDVYVAYWNITLGKGIDDVIHSGEEDSIKYNLKDKQIVKLKVFGEKGGILDNVKVKVLKDAYFECHLDLDDANAHLISNKDVGEIIYE